MGWIKKKLGYNKSSYKWIWVPDPLDIAEYDETTLNIPKRKTSDIVLKNGEWSLINKGRRQYSQNPKTALVYLRTDRTGFFRILDKPIEAITLKEKAEFLELVHDKTQPLKVDARNMGLEAFGFKVKLGRKRYVEVERIFGYKKEIHKLPSKTPQNLVYEKHLEYLRKHFTEI